MACNQQRGYSNASNTTTLLVRAKYCVSEELLIDSCLDRLRHREALRQVDNSLGDNFFYILTRQLSFDLLCHKG